MIWALFEIALPLILATLLGLLIGWLLWRWRRRVVTASLWNSLQGSGTANTEMANATVDIIRERNELSGQLNSLNAQNSKQRVLVDALEKSATALSDELNVTKLKLSEANADQASRAVSALAAQKAQIKSQEMTVGLSNMAAKNVQLANEVVALNADNGRLRDVAGKYEKLEVSSQSLRADLEVANTRIVELDSELKKSAVDMDESASVRLQLTQKEARISELEPRLIRLQDTEDELAQLKRQQAEWQLVLNQSRVDADELASVRKRLETNQNQQQGVAREAAQTSAQLVSTRAQVADLKRQLEDQSNYQKNLALSEEKLASLQKSQDELQHRFNMVQKEKTEAVLANEKLVALEQSGQSTAQLEAELKRVREKSALTEQRNKELQEKIKASESDRQKLIETKTQMAALQGQYRNLSRKIDLSNQVDTEKNQLNSKLTQVLEESEATKNELGLLKKQKEAIATQEERTRHRITELEAELERNKQEYSQSKSTQVELDNLKQQLLQAERKAADSAETKEKTRQLEDELATARRLADSNRVDADKSRTTETKLAAAEKTIAGLQAEHVNMQEAQVELASARAEIESLENQMEKLYSDSTAEPTKEPASRGKFSAVVTRAIQSASSESTALDDPSGKSADVKSAIGIRKAASKPVKSGKEKKKKNRAKDKSWKKGTTKLGTPGAVHKDDLKVISGIGPVLEKTLNEFEIQSWEQIAALTPKDVKTVDAAMAFPGRITRELWIEQAIELVAEFPVQEDRPTRKTFAKKMASQ